MSKLRERFESWQEDGSLADLRGIVENMLDAIDELGAALRELQRLGEEGMKPDPNEWLTFHDKVAQIARATLTKHGLDHE